MSASSQFEAATPKGETTSGRGLGAKVWPWNDKGL